MSGPLSFDPIDEARRQWVTHGWEDAAAGMAAVTSVVRAQQLLVARVDAVLAQWDLVLARFEVLRLLDFSREGSLPMGKMGVRLQVHPTSVTNAVDRLERQGLVERRPHPTDGRTTLAVITPTGRRTVAAATVALNEEVFGQLGLGERELGQLFALLRKVRVAAGDLAGR